MAARQPEEPKLLGWRLWRGLGKSKFGDQRGFGRGAKSAPRGSATSRGFWLSARVQLAQLGRTPTCLSLGGIE